MPFCRLAQSNQFQKSANFLSYKKKGKKKRLNKLGQRKLLPENVNTGSEFTLWTVSSYPTLSVIQYHT